ncbi:sensor histidine kinase [Ferrimonas marina]|uniref:histidine kinase n=1 Tax=Ferrimonas marina TaxID=299255 RepID=A0A1M5XW96_9GAMM|nr:HAMP domain-containing sensor histidine kinase [Ferrimonas marina]SHI03834.1 two-component system, NtrC family, sensor kinase [Ferrimonas marina]
MLGRWRRQFRNDVRVLTSTVRYRLLVLMLLPVLVTLASLVFITIYWNVTYTGNQLFMKVRSDLAVAQGVLSNEAENQQLALRQLQHAWEFTRLIQSLTYSDRSMDRLLERNREQLGLQFLRLVSLEQAQSDPQLRPLIPESNQWGRSSLQVLSRQQMLQISPVLAREASMPLQPTPMAMLPMKGFEQRGLVGRSLVEVRAPDGRRVGFLDGGVLLNHNTDLVDGIRELTYADGTLPARTRGTVTLFLDNVRISTNVPSDDGYGRAIGTLVSEQVRLKVLEQGEMWVDRAFVYNDWYISAYAPLTDINGDRIGMIYTGFTEAPFVHNYLMNIVELGTILLLVMLGSGLAVFYGAAGLLKPIDRIHSVVRDVQLGHDGRIGDLGLDPSNELAQLGHQFDRMLDQLQERNRQIQLANDQLEQKVEQRTEILKRRTQELKRNIELLNETRQQMVTNEKLVALGEMTAGIAHEINNPTAVILGNMELIKLELGDQADSIDDEIELIFQQVQRIKEIIQSLLQYARPGDLNMPLKRQTVNPIVEEMLVLVRHSLRKQSVAVDLELEADQLVEVNRQQLLQVLINLVVNAAHAMDGQGQVRVRSGNWQEQGQLKGVWISVSDDGIGIPPELQTRIFDPFFTTRKQGTGLGLSLSYGIIRRFGGVMELESQPNVGSTFTIRLPLQSPAMDGESAPLPITLQ